MSTAATPSANPPPSALSRFLRPWGKAAIGLALLLVAAAGYAGDATIVPTSDGARTNGATAGQLVAAASTANHVTFTVVFSENVYPKLLSDGALHANTTLLKDVFGAAIAPFIDPDGAGADAATTNYSIQQTDARTFIVKVGVTGGLTNKDLVRLDVNPSLMKKVSGGAAYANAVTSASITYLTDNGGLTVIEVPQADYTGFLNTPTVFGSFTTGSVDAYVNVTGDDTAKVDTIGTDALWSYSPTAAVTAGYKTYTFTGKSVAGYAPTATPAITKKFYVWNAPALTYITPVSGASAPGDKVEASATDPILINNTQPYLEGTAGFPNTVDAGGITVAPVVTINIYDQLAPAIPVVPQMTGTISAGSPAVWKVLTGDWTGSLPTTQDRLYNVVINMRINQTAPVADTADSQNSITVTRVVKFTSANATGITITAGNFVTNVDDVDHTPTINITAGATSNAIKIYYADGDADDSNDVEYPGTVTGSGLPYLWTAGAAKLDGTYNLYAKWTNAAGVTTSKADCNANARLVFKPYTPQPTIAPTNFVTNVTDVDHTPIIAVTTVLPSSTIKIYNKNANAAFGADVEVPGTLSGDNSPFTWTANAPLTSNITYTLYAKLTDAAGNVSPESAQVIYRPAATAPSIALIGATPTPRHLPTFTILADTDLDGAVDDTIVTGTGGDQTAAIVQFSTNGDVDGSYVTKAGTFSGSTWTPTAQLLDGTYKVRAYYRQANGFISAASTAIDLVITTPYPTLAAGANVTVLAASSADGNNQYLGLGLAPQIAVTGVDVATGTLTMYRIPRTSAGLEITPFTNDRTTINGVITDGARPGTVVVPGTLARTDATNAVWTASTVGGDAFADQTPYSLFAKWTDDNAANGTDTAGGHTNAIAAASNKINVRAISAVSYPAITEIHVADGSGSNLYTPGSVLTLESGAIEIKGTGNAGATLKLFDNGNSMQTIVIPSTGNWTYVLSDDPADSPVAVSFTSGNHTLTAKQLDLCGVESVVTPTSVFITIDDHQPLPPSITTPSVSGTKTSDTTPTFGGTAEPNSTVTLYCSLVGATHTHGAAGLVATTTASGSGNWSVDTSVLNSAADPGQIHTIFAKATSPANVVSDASSSIDIYIVDPELKVRLEPIAKGTGSLYVTNGAMTIGKTVIAIDTGTGSVLKGDTVRFAHAAGSDDNTDYTVVTGVSGPGNITITPGLKAARVDGEAMTIQPNPKGVIATTNGNAFPCSLSQILLTATFSDGANLAVDEILPSVFNASKITISQGSVVTAVTKGTGLPGDQPTNVWTIAITPATSGTLTAKIEAGKVYTSPGNVITGFSITNGGSNYVGTPTISITGGTAGAATYAGDADGIIENGEITLNNRGYGYTTPVVKVVPEPGAGATFTVTRNGTGVITAVTVVNKGSGWRSGVAPNLVVTDTVGTGAILAAVMEANGATGNFRVASVTVTNGGTGYTSATRVTATNGSGAVVSATTVPGTVTFNTASTSHIAGDPAIVLTAPLDPATVGTGAMYSLALDRTRPTVTWSWAANGNAQLRPSTNPAGGAMAAGDPITTASYVKMLTPASNTTFKVRAKFSSPMSRALLKRDLTLVGCTMTSDTGAGTVGDPWVPSVDITDIGGLHQEFDIKLTRSTMTGTGMGVTVKAMADLFDTAVPAQLNFASPAFLATSVPDPIAPVIDSLTNKATYLIPSRVASYPCTVTFVAPVSVFGPDNLTVTNGVITRWAGALPGKVFSFTLTPGEGQVSVQYNSTSAYNIAHPLTDVAGTPIPSSNTFTRILDSTQPVIEAVSSPLFNKVDAAATGSGDAAAATVVLAASTGAGGAATATVANGVITGFTVTNDGTAAYTYAPQVTITDTTGSGATAVAVINGAGDITGITVVNGGSGYSNAPTVTITKTGRVATGAMTLVRGGTGYAVAPTVTFTGGDGSGAAATATINADGEITGITVTSGGNGYTSAPTVVINNSVRPLNNGAATTRFPVRVTFSEAPKTFPLASVVASLSSTGKAISLSAPLGSAAGAVGPQVVANTAGKIWEFDLMVTSAVTGADTIRLVVPALGVTDNATNQSQASAVFPITYDMVNGTPVEAEVNPTYSSYSN